ncbi:MULTISPECIES: fimbrial protein [Providencia]|uniref:Fimbrial protein n=1 Tax=Providencia rettgeri TaxID=587 RepID=A0AAD2VUB3_PRORE|nr:fimbrial protein [Providencia rettgeri]ELR5075058.1 fimbrial protein [Providencia stuartii]ELR5070836.1 fimbrial protein [Providencia rettgeri]ELR5218880.1 fimbrial protein [Providencia rettgeri]ELR5221941.1 fimbrial protein [Providencia rettgeri]MBV2188381.1 fimbrial protein [Providencia rettgeri]
MIKHMLIGLFFISGMVISGVIGGMASASEFLNHTAVNESHYEDSNSGWLEVSARLFNSPCHLKISTSTVILTQCGAGGAFSADKTQTTPAQIRFYDVQNGNVTTIEKMNLFNGNNFIHPPASMHKSNLLRLEVVYE